MPLELAVWPGELDQSDKFAIVPMTGWVKVQNKSMASLRNIDANLSVSEFSKLTTTLFSASIGQVPWDQFLSELGHRTGGICTHIFGFDTEAKLTMDMVSSGYDPDFLKTFDEHFAALNAWGPGFAEKAAGKVIDCEEMLASEELVKTEFYNDWLRPQEDIKNGGGALLFKSDTRVFALGGNIRTRDVARLKEPWLRTVGQLIPHMQQAFEISRALAGSKLETAIVASKGLREVPAILLLSETGRVVFANGIAEQMLADGIPVFLDRQGVLSFSIDENERRSSSEVLRYRLSTANPSFSVSLKPTNQSASYDVRFAKLSEEAGIPFPLDRSLGLSGRCCLVIVSKRSLSTSMDIVLKLRGLTGTEIQIALLLMEGHSAQEIADERATSIYTVRNQTKSIMAKLDVNRQADLMRLLLKLKSE